MPKGDVERVATWAAQECFWQGVSALHVGRMVQAWSVAHRRRLNAITVDSIKTLGYLVAPEANSSGWRQQRVWVGNRLPSGRLAPGADEKIPWENVPKAMVRLVEVQPEIGGQTEAASTWFKNFEDVHPFLDGNGRVGSILYNWLCGSLPTPVHPPNHWQERRRSYDGYPIPDLDPPDRHSTRSAVQALLANYAGGDQL